MAQNGKVVEEKFIVEYKKQFYDVTKFLKKHPGGSNSLQGYNRKDIEEKFKKIEHSPAAEYLLKDYKLKEQTTSESELDESLEHLIDWNEALVPQISKLGDVYQDWVHKPVDRQIRMFSNPVLESLSKTSWYAPLLFWTPVITFLILHGSSKVILTDHSFPLSVVLTDLIKGILTWTLVEYILHKYLFHMNVGKNSKWATFHFLLHGVHHKAPFDQRRLVFPPAPAAVFAVVLYQILLLINFLFNGLLCNDKIFMAGALSGYLCYDMIHYYIHFGSPRNSYFYDLKRYHYNHHFANQDQGFGISSPFWDLVFGTKIVLKKLKYVLKW